MKKQEIETHREEKKQSIENDPKIIQMLELTNRDLEGAIINVFKDWRENMVIMNRWKPLQKEKVFLKSQM